MKYLEDDEPFSLIVKKLTKELRRLQGDFYLDEVVMNSLCENEDNFQNTMKKFDFMKKIKYKQGMFDAYMDILKILEKYVDENDSLSEN